MATFGERMKNLRNQEGITLDELATKIHSTKATLSRYENSIRTPNIDFARKIAVYFNVSADYVMGNDNSKEDEQGASMTSVESEAHIDKEYKYIVDKAKSLNITPERLDKLIDFLNSDK